MSRSLRHSPLIVGFSLLCALGVGASPAQAGAAQEKARAAYKEGLRSYRAGNLDEALALFRTSEDADPTYPFSPFALGRIYQQLFDQETRYYEEAGNAYERVALLLRASPPAQKDRPLYQVYYFLGLLYLKGGDYAQAQASLQQFLQVYPDFDNPQDVYNAIGIALYYQDQYDKAVEHFRTALARAPGYAEARFNLRSVFTRLAVYNEATVLARAGEMELALEKVGRLKEFAPRYLPGRRLEGMVLQRLGRRAEAVKVYQEALGFDPADPLTYPVRLELARILADQGHRDEALGHLTENLRRFPDIGDARVQREVTDLMARLGEQP